MNLLATTLALASILSLSALAQPLPPDVGRALAAIETDDIQGHLRFLADDLLEGRAAGTRGYDVAARWLASSFTRLGLEPAGQGGTYFQQVPFVSSLIVPEETSLVIHGPKGDRALRIWDDFTVTPNPLRDREEVRAQVVFAGFGIDAPDLEWNDYAKIDVRGRIVAIAVGAPAHFPSTRRAHYGSTSNKLETAANRGASGVIFIRGEAANRRYPWERARRQSKTPSFRWLRPDGTPGRHRPELNVVATLGPAGAKALFEGSRIDFDRVMHLEENGKKSLTGVLPVEVTLRSQTRREQLTSPNVAGILRGSDPSLAHEVVVYTAHLDHIGVTDPVDGDSINNGAFDNASGTAALLEAARAFDSLPRPPKRSILFLAVTAEEKGLLGSDYFAQFPTVPAGDIVANINVDMFLMLFPLKDVVVYGYEHSTLSRAVDRATAHLGVTRIDDPSPEEASFVRSDQYSFVRQGVPAIAINEGVGTGWNEAEGRRLVGAWLQERYHTPKDDLRQPIVWEAGRDLARLAFLVGYLVAEDPARPQWNEGDFFGSMKRR